MLGSLEVFSGMLVLGDIATANVATAQAQPQMHPTVAGRQTFFATVGSLRSNVFVGLLDVRASVHKASISELAGWPWYLGHPILPARPALRERRLSLKAHAGLSAG